MVASQTSREVYSRSECTESWPGNREICYIAETLIPNLKSVNDDFWYLYVQQASIVGADFFTTFNQASCCISIIRNMCVM
jgi:hypothetical protein